MGIPALAFFGIELKTVRPSQTIENPQVIGEHIKNRRLQLKLKQADVAKVFEICEDSITGWENGRSEPQIQFYPKIIKFLGYNPFPVNTENLGGRIKNYRITQGLSHKKFGQKIGVDASTISAWEEGKHKPTSKMTRILEEIINQKEISK